MIKKRYLNQKVFLQCSDPSIAGDSRDIFLHRVKDAELCLSGSQAAQLFCGNITEEREGLSGPPHCQGVPLIQVLRTKFFGNFENRFVLSMGRHVLAVQAHCGSVHLDLFNTHLESTKEHAEERGRQLKQCLAQVYEKFGFQAF